jgi:hypothetical protein
MEKAKKNANETTNSNVYKKLRGYVVHVRCTHCAPNRGCNRRSKISSSDNKSWKSYRKTQWRGGNHGV